MANRFLTAKITNLHQLRDALGAHEAVHFIKRALKRIERDARVSGGRLEDLSPTQITVEYANEAQAVNMALQIDEAVNELPMPKGQRIEAAAWVEDRGEPLPAAVPQPDKPVALRYRNIKIMMDRKNPRVTIGRDIVNQLVISDLQVSRKHATLTWDENQVVLRDDSANGTFILPAGAAEEIKVKHAELRVGGTACISFGLPLSKSAGKPIWIDLIFD